MYALKDSVLTIVRALKLPDGSAVPAGSPVPMRSHTKVTADPGGKAAYIKGAAMLPIDIVNQTAEPKVDIDFSNGPELWTARNAVGGIGSTIIVTLVLQRVNFVPIQFLFPGTWANGGGIELDETNGSKPDKLSIMCLDILQDLRSIFNQFA